MTPEMKRARARIQEIVRTWKRLVPPGWDVSHVFIEGVIDEDRPDVLAETHAHWQYHQARIKWSLAACCAQSYKYIEGTLVHELVHCYLGALEEHLRTEEDDKWAQNLLCEHTVDHIARAILRVAL